MTATENVRTENKMGTAPVLPLILSMSFPAMLSMLVQALYNVVDSYFVSQLSENALTAVSLAFPMQNLLIAIAVGTGVGINSLVARRLGEKDQLAADNAAAHGLLLGLVNWVLFLVIGLFFAGPFIGAFTDIPDIFSMGSQYLSCVCIFSFGVCIEVNVEKTLQATGNMIWPMVFQLTGAVINIILDPIFIFGFLGVPAMGVLGAAVATVIGQILSMILALSVLFLGKNHAVAVKWREFRLSLQTVRNIYAVGLPSIIMQAIGTVMTVCMNAILIRFTETAVAVFGVYFKIQSFVFMPVFGLNQGVMPIMGYNFGAKNRKRMMEALRYGMLIALGIMLAGFLLFQFLSPQLLSIFNASEQMLAIGVPALRIISICFVPAAISILISTMFQAVGKGIYSMYVSVLRQLAVLVPAAFLLAGIGLEAVWFSFPIAEVFGFGSSIFLFLRLKKKVLSQLPG